MKYPVYLLFFIFYFSCNPATKEKKIKENDLKEMSDSDKRLKEDSFLFFDIEESLENAESKQFKINDIADSIRFIILEITDESLINERNLKYYNIAGKHIVSGAEMQRFELFEFAPDGSFIKKLSAKGNGPNEYAIINSTFTNDSLQKVCLIDFIQKMIVYDFKNDTVYSVRIDNLANGGLLNNGYFVTTHTNANNVEDNSILFVYNQNGELIKTFYYPEKRDNLYIEPIPPNIEVKFSLGREIYDLYQTYTGDVLWRDLFNDTIYSINSDLQLLPRICFHRGKYTPGQTDVRRKSEEKKDPKIFYEKVGVSEKYVFLNFIYQDRSHSQIWDKHKGKLISYHITDLVYSNSILEVQYQTPNGKNISVEVIEISKNQLFCKIPAEEAMEFMPGIEEEDNPVIMVVNL